MIESGVTGLSTRRKLDPAVRVSHLIESLDELAGRWDPHQPSGINWLAGAGVGPVDSIVGHLVLGTCPPSILLHGPRSQNSNRRAPKRLPRPTGVRHHAAFGVDRAGPLHPRMGGHRRGPLPPHQTSPSLIQNPLSQNPFSRARGKVRMGHPVPRRPNS